MSKSRGAITAIATLLAATLSVQCAMATQWTATSDDMSRLDKASKEQDHEVSDEKLRLTHDNGVSACVCLSSLYEVI